ncbi:MAG: hypothetical protein V2I51_02000, partial [Anderseniella sp.]|nr:hypothetical protein [Anderseniella sp.]
MQTAKSFRPCQAMATGTYGCSADQVANLALLPVWGRAHYSSGDEYGLRCHRRLFDAFQGGKWGSPIPARAPGDVQQRNVFALEHAATANLAPVETSFRTIHADSSLFSDLGYPSRTAPPPQRFRMPSFHLWPESRLRLARWALLSGWILLIAMLLMPGLTPWQPTPPCDGLAWCEGNWGNDLFWNLGLPLVLLTIVLSHELWRRICPLSFVSQLFSALKR